MPKVFFTDSASLSKYANWAEKAAEATLGEPMLYKSRVLRFLYMRVIMTEWLRQKGLTLVQIGGIIGKSHSVVIHNLMQLDGLRYYGDFREMRTTFRNEIENYENQDQEDTPGRGDTLQDPQ